MAALLAAGGYPEAADIVRAAFESDGLPGGLPALLEWEEIAYAMRQVASGDPHPSVAGIKAGNFGGGFARADGGHSPRGTRHGHISGWLAPCPP